MFFPKTHKLARGGGGGGPLAPPPPVPPLFGWPPLMIKIFNFLIHGGKKKEGNELKIFPQSLIWKSISRYVSETI